jgi:hypothetical protein
MALTIVALLSWLTISPGWPRIYAPFNLLVMLPYLWSSSDILAVAVVPLFFAIWSWPVLHGDPALPTRSVVLLIFGVVLSAAWLLIGYRYGIQYESTVYVVGVAIINIVCWTLLGLFALLTRRRPTFIHNLGFHAALFAWLAWCAFPYLGELL